MMMRATPRQFAPPSANRALASPGHQLDRRVIARVGPALRPLLRTRSVRPSTVPVGNQPLRIGDASDVEESAAARVAGGVERGDEPLRTSDWSRLHAVRIHDDAAAARSAADVKADAYAVPGHVVFGASMFDPESAAGRSLIAHELAHAVTAPQAPLVLRRQPTLAPGATFRQARTMSAYIDLVREAERRLNAAGVSSVDDRIQILSGIYYGTDWSLDLETERSQAREVAFRAYTGRATQGQDPRPILGQSLFDALKHSQDVSVAGIPDVDVGHVMIGLNARSSGWTPRSLPIPTQGGTGLELSTWVGDLGAATGRLADDRMRSPAKPARVYFPGRGTDYGADSNLEGDLGAYLAASTTGSTSVEGLVLAPGATIADSLQAYFAAPGGGPGGRGAARPRTDRARHFLEIQGATFSGSTLTNRATIEAQFAAKFQAFGRWYLGTRYGPTRAYAAQPQLARAGADVAREFVDWLLRRI